MELFNKNSDFVWIKRNISPKEHLSIIDLGEVVLQTKHKPSEQQRRIYPYSYVGSHILGYTNIKKINHSGIEILKDNPFFGVGPNNYPWTSGDYFHLSPFFDEAARFRSGRQAHSLYFTLVPELGFFGIILFSYITLKKFLSCL